jgi:cytochrome c oxidase subunit 2
VIQPPSLLATLTERLPGASSFAARVDGVFAGLLITGAVVIVILTALTLTFLIRYRREAKVNRAAVRIATWKIETAWTVGTTLVFLGFFFWGATVYLDIKHPPAGDNVDEINVIGRQWMWDIRHPDGRREFNTMHVLVNRPVRLLLSSEDVIHSFFVPAFRLKQDLVPGKTVEAWFEPTRTGTYTLFCAQYCGTEHSEMLGQIIVQSPADYATWLAGDWKDAAAAAARNADPRLRPAGHRLFVQYGCSVCHDSATTVRAPSLVGIFGQRVRLSDGTLVRADDQYLHDSILHASQQVVAGYGPTMPTYDGVVSEADVLTLVSYLKSLTPATAVPPGTIPPPQP